MNPKTNPTSDSLISGLNVPGQSAAPPDPSPDISSTGLPAYQPQQPNPPIPTSTSYTESPDLGSTFTPGIQSTPTSNEPMQNPSFQAIPTQTSEPLTSSSFQQPDNNINQAGSFTQQPPISQQPVVQQNQVGGQMTSSLDPPPSPPSQPQQVESQINLGNAVVQEKPKRKIPVFLLILLLLVIVVIGAVGFLAYQNFNLSKNIPKTTTTTNQQIPLQQPPTVDQYAGYKKFVSTILPIEFMVPSDWTTQESKDENLGNQKLIKADSPDFSYGESEIVQGYEFRIGPVTDLAKKYSSFDAFSVEENTDNLYTSKTINSVSWLVKGNEAKTLIDETPVTIALYSGTSQVTAASDIFNKILNSITITTTPVNITPTLKPASPSATPLE